MVSQNEQATVMLTPQNNISDDVAAPFQPAGDLSARKPPVVSVREKKNIPEFVTRNTAAQNTLSQGIMHLTFGR
jgi:hypothetical protein